MTKKIHDSESPAIGQQAITACALIHHTFAGTIKVFLPKRAATKKFLPSKYEIPGGHIDYGENLVDGLRREIREEFGIEISVGAPFAAFDYVNTIKGSHSIEVVYFATLTGHPEDIIIHPEDHSSGDWYSEADIPAIKSANGEVDDSEIEALKTGFALLNGKSPNVG